jgi:hypothetical protein
VRGAAAAAVDRTAGCGCGAPGGGRTPTAGGPGPGRLAVGSLADRVSNSLLRVFAAAQAMVVVVTNCIPVNEAYAIEYAPVLRTLHVYVLRDSWSCS